jgi:hypothetical protein
MPNKLTIVIAAAALTLCGQAFAQYPVVQPTERSPNLSPVDPAAEKNTPAERMEPQSNSSDKADSHKSHKSAAKKKSKSGKKSTDSNSDSSSPTTNYPSTSPSQ